MATNALLQGDIKNLGLVVTEGYRHILEIARQSVPDGYGNSYFWVKPERMVPLELVREVGGRLDYRGRELRSLDENTVREAARFFRHHGVKAAAVCLIHSYANPAHERRVGELLAEEYPELVVSLSCDVLPEYREYERAVTTLVDAFVKPHMAVYLRRIRTELGEDLGTKPFLVMQSSGGVVSAERCAEHPITTVLSGPAAGSHRRLDDREARRLSRRGDARCRRHLDRHLPGGGGRRAHHQQLLDRQLPGARADDRHPHHRHRRRLDRLDLARGPPQGRPEERRRGAGTDVLPERRRSSRPSPTPTLRSAACRRR